MIVGNQSKRRRWFLPSATFRSHSSMTPRTPFIAWPGWRLLAEASVLGTAQSAWWVFVYFGANWVTAMRTDRVRIHLEAELSIPFVPLFLIVYRSIDVLFLLGPFVLRSRAEIRALSLALFLATTTAGVCFLLIPAELAYPPLPVEGFWADAFAFNERIVLRYNLVPSLHVALSTIVLAAYGTFRGTRCRVLLAVWGGLIALSTLLIHQHHVLDVVTGLLLGWACYRLVYRRWLRAAARTAPASLSSDPVSFAIWASERGTPDAGREPIL
jgi:membrane-associated phospholipid phosphatase